MRLVSFTGGFGRLEGDMLFPMGPSLRRWLEAPESAVERAPIPLSSVRLMPPVPDPGKIIGVGLNYREHVEEQDERQPEEPALFAKFASALCTDGDDIEVPLPVIQPDWEAELGVVIGRTARDVSVDEALDCVGGYTCVNDVTARDLMRGNWQRILRAKAIDSFLPCGPWLVTADEVADPQALPIRCLVNGEVMQDSSTAHMIHSVASLISYLSRTMTLAPGDLIATGTPSGCGVARTPQRFLKHGDEVVVEIDGVGRLANRVLYHAHTWSPAVVPDAEAVAAASHTA